MIFFSIHKLYDGKEGQRGEDGQTGSSGENAPSVFLTNENITFAANEEGKVTGTTVYCNAVAYVGTTKVKPTLGVISGAISGMTIETVVDESLEVPIKITIANNAMLGNSVHQSGVISVQVTSPVETTLTITWSKVNTGKTGENAVVFSIYAPQGNTFKNQNGTLNVVAAGYHGSNSLTTTDASFTWYKYVGTDWLPITMSNSTTLAVNGADVVNVGSYKCIMTYNLKNIRRCHYAY